MKKILIILIALITIIGTITTSAQRGRGEWKKGFNDCKQLNLTDEQQERFDKIKFEHQELKIELDAKLKKNQLEIKKLLSADNFNESDLMNLVQMSTDIRAEKNMSRTKMWLNVYNILDNEQKEMWKKRFNKIGMKRGKFSRMGKGDCINRSSKRNRM